MKKTNKFLSLVLAILLFVGVMPIDTFTAFASDETYTLTLVYEYEIWNGEIVGTGIDDVVIENIPHGTVVDLSDYWIDEMTVTGSEGNTYYFGNYMKNAIGSTICSCWEVTSDQTLYACWMVHPMITVTFDGNGGNVIYDKRKSNYNSELVDENNANNIPYRGGFRFIGWSYSKDSIVGDTNELVTNDCTLYAHWEKLRVQVGQVELEDGEYTTNGMSKIAGEPTGTGYAYFKDGVLTLNNFTYSGGGYNLSAIYYNHALTIKVEGENNITRDVTSDDTDTKMALRGIRVENGKLTIIGDSKDDSLRVVVDGHDDVSASGIYGDTEGIDIYNCTLEARSVNGGKGLNAPGNITITGAKVIGASEATATSLNNQGIYAGILKVNNSDVIGIADNTSPGRATGIYLDASKSKLIFESGTIVGEVSNALGNSYAIYIHTNAATLPAKYWMRTSVSGDFAESTWDGANVGPYIELTTSKLQNEWVLTPTIRGWIYNTVKSTPQAEAKYGTVEFKYYDADKNLLTELPDNAGTYYLKGFVAETDNYTGLESDYVWFAVEKDEQIPPRPTGVNTTYIDTNDGKITGVDSTMEYRKDGETNYIAVTGTEITNLAAGTYYVRYAATDNYNASPDKVITVSLGGKRTPTIDTDPTASRVIIDGKLSDSTLTGGVASVDGKFEWKNGTDVLGSKGTVQKTVVFTPDDAENYNPVEFEIEVEVVVCDTESGEHEYTEQKTNADEHWNVCAKCGVEEADSREAHYGGTATCTEKAKCEVCGEKYGEMLDHKYEWVIDKEPSTTEEGLKHEECECGDRRNENTVIPKTENPQTGDSYTPSIVLMMILSVGIGTFGVSALKRKKNSN